MKITIRTKKIGSFIKNLNGAERNYLLHCLNTSNSIKRLIKEFNLEKKFVCERFKIKANRYNDFVSGNFNYSLEEISKLNVLFMELESEKLKDKVPVQIAKSSK